MYYQSMQMPLNILRVLGLDLNLMLKENKGRTQSPE